MKRTIILSMAGLVLLAACQKEISPVQQEKSGMTLSATVEQQTYGTKTALGTGNTVVWSDNDEVRVWNGDTNTNTPFTLTEGAGTTQGIFNGDEIANPQYAFYPSSAVTGVSGPEVTFTLPAVQHYVENSFGNGANVAVAQISGNNMSFKNICGVLKLQLKGTTVVKTITITGKSNEKLNGTYTVDASASTPDMSCTTTEVDSEKSVTLDCGEGVVLNANTETAFNIVLPKGSLTKGFNLTINDVRDHKESIIGPSNEIKRKTILAMPSKTLTINSYILNGVFSVSASTTISFSQGNLLVHMDGNGNADEWLFSPNQLYDIPIEIDPRSGVGYTNLFALSTDGVGATSGWRQWGVGNVPVSTDVAGNFVDWGTNPSLISTVGSNWRCLTDEECNYLFIYRAASTINGVANARHTGIKVNEAPGILLFPDLFTWDAGTMGTAPAAGHINNLEQSIEDYPNYTSQQFEKIEEAGGVFLFFQGWGDPNYQQQVNKSNYLKEVKIWIYSSSELKCLAMPEKVIERFVFAPPHRRLLVRLIKEN